MREEAENFRKLEKLVTMKPIMTGKPFFVSLATVIICLVGSFPLYGDVFTIWPFSGGGAKPSGNNSGSNVIDILQATKLWSEPVIINGRRLSLGISLVRSDLKTCVIQLRDLYPKASMARNSNSVLMNIKLANEMQRRIFLIELNGPFPVIAFSMDIPKKIPDRFSWPSDIPIPSGATPISYMEFPKRDATYGHFSFTAASASQALGEMKSSLSAMGWKAVTRESSTSIAEGEIFLRDNPKSIMIVNLSLSKNSSTGKGSVYLRPLK